MIQGNGGLPRLDEASSDKESISRALEQLNAYLVQRGEDPREFFLSQVNELIDQIELGISHQNDFRWKNRRTKGNQSGQSRMCVYDLQAKDVIECLYYQ